MDKDLFPSLNLYIGAPVILRGHKNIQDLRITNGLQGVVTEPPYDNERTAVTAIVEFRDSPVQLKGLPPGYFPVVPMSTRVRQIIVEADGSRRELVATRAQLPLQLAFSVAGHSAQGKTIPHVITDMLGRGNGPYVAVSRARDCHGLVIANEITSLAQLNGALPVELVKDMKRLVALTQNTTVQHDQLFKGSRVRVTDAESKANVRIDCH